MSFVLNGFQLAGSILRTNLTARVIPVRFIRLSFAQFDEENKEIPAPVKEVPPHKDRSKIIPVETSIRYMQSDAYKQTYGNDPVWKLYRRNHKGGIPPQKTRKTCIRKSVISAGNPCPICRDEYLVVDFVNVNLLKQFISDYNGEILSYKKTGLCQMSHKKLLVAILKAREYGLLTFDIPFKYYDYSEWKSA
ncbi:28S ribosomal protein S18b, mitochondrial [Colletes gigas]|uniref:28S ribosomal protein S18b, mitochondrial n=1 Tax=Colletes gigas TaxID=935657 RepID=UPI001C9AA9F6|nr:28S ribosomal protein S18b, mitochondrial [Colletes gigas]